MKLKDGLYEVPYSTDYDRGYGVESSADEIIIAVEGGKFVGAFAYGLHFVSEQDCEWEVDLSDEDAYNLIREKL